MLKANQSVINALAEFAITFKSTDEARTAARTAVFDGAACLVGGTREDFGRILHQYAAELAAESGQSSIICSPWRAAPAVAAYINAAAGHSLCYDDTSNAMMGHPTVVVLPAVLAVGEHLGCSGLDLLDAYTVGVEVAVRVSEVIAPQHYQRGWHATGICGGLGAAAAAGRLLDLNAGQTARAIAIAATSAQGLRANFGSMAMIYHAGLAARGGVDAAYLAARSMTAAADPLSGVNGYFSMFNGLGAGRADYGRQLVLADPLELVNPGLDVKPYPCGSLGHRAIQGILELRQAHDLDPERVRRIVCRLPQLHQEVLVHTDPDTILASRISLVYPVSVAMLNGSCTLPDFTMDLLRSPRVRALMRKVAVEPLRTSVHSGADLFAAPAQVIVEMDGGAAYEKTVQAVKGSPQNPLSPAEWQAKFDECVVPSLGRDGAGRLNHLLRSLEELADVRELTAALALRPAEPAS